MDSVLIQLGRLGDVINILPILEEENRNGKRLTLMVAKEFAGLLDGVSYCDVLPWDGAYDKLVPAESWARSRAGKVKTAQVWGTDYKHTRTTDNFQRDAWNRVGYARRWEQHALIFDRRDMGREHQLMEDLLWKCNKPIVLLALKGFSAPFADWRKLKDTLEKECGQDFNFVDISNVVAERFYDLLGVYNMAEALITIDTATLHLAQASSVPVIALNPPNGWLGSVRRTNHMVRMDYNRINMDCIKAALYSTQYKVGKLLHVYSEYRMKPDDQRRVDLAKRSWEKEYCLGGCWHPKPIDYAVKLPRGSKSVLKDDRDVPFVKDMIEYGFTHSTSADDVVVLTNSDVGFTPGMTESLRRLVACKGACYAYRWDFGGNIHHLLEPYEVLKGKFLGGLDLFAFSRGWWMKHRDDAPDMVLGSTMWDLTFRDLIKKNGGGELYAGIWHELHGSYWKEFPRTAGNMHNINLANLWWTQNDTTRPFKYL